MNKNDTYLAIYLFFSKGIGIVNSKIIFNLMEKNADNFFYNGREILMKNNFNKKLIEELFSEKTKIEAEIEIDFCQKNGIEIIPFWSEKYPNNLKLCNDAPILLFQKGNINWKSSKIISIVGTRSITNYGKKVLKNFIEDIKIYDPIIVSGLALGVDIESHKSALENDLSTIAILGSGLNNIYPSEHKKIVEEIFKGGGIVSEYSFNTPPSRENFPRRNRIIAGVCSSLIVIESKISGGSMITANIANSYNRDVFAVPGRLDDKYSEGCNFLIERNIASIYNSIKNLEYILGWDIKPKKKIQIKILEDFSDEEKLVLDQIEKEEKVHIDSLSINLGIPTFKLAPILLDLEIKGIIQSSPGKIFSLV